MLEREREEGEEKQPFSDFTGFCRSELGRPRVKAILHYESYAWVPESQNFSNVQGSGFHINQEKAVSLEIKLIEVEFLSYLV